MTDELILIPRYPHTSRCMHHGEARITRILGDYGMTIACEKIWMGRICMSQRAIAKACGLHYVSVWRYVKKWGADETLIDWLLKSQVKRFGKGDVMERFEPDRFINEKFKGRKSQIGLARFLIAYGVCVHDRGFWIGPIEIPVESVSRASGCVSETAKELIDTVEHDDELRRYLVQCSYRV